MRKLYWILLNNSFLAITIAGTFFSIQGAINVVYFMSGLTLFFGVACLVPDIAESIADKGYAFNKYAEFLYDIAITLILVYTGFWFSAIAYFTGNLLIMGARGK